jgi:hypothetical protein
MVPGQHHVRMNMYIAKAIDGQFNIVKTSARSIRTSARST